MWFGIISLFPEMFQALELGVSGRALKGDLIQLAHFNPRDYAKDKHQTVDDKPYGGGPGMVMMYEPLRDALSDAKDVAGGEAKTILLSPQGKLLDHKRVVELSQLDRLILVCGRYEGIDERIQHHIDDEYSIGDYVLSGGELAAMVLIDSITRQIPGSLGNALSAEQDSHADGLLDFPQYTRPKEVDGYEVPEVLTSGHHQKIERWRLTKALEKTLQVRPELLDNIEFDAETRELLDEIKAKFDDLETTELDDEAFKSLDNVKVKFDDEAGHQE